MNELLERDFQEKISKLRDKTNVLHFSCGADSVASYLRLKEHDINPILVYHYFIKDLPMVKNYIDWFCKRFNERIYQISSTLWAEHIDNALFQLPIKAREKFRNNIAATELYLYTKEVGDLMIKDALGGEVVFHLGLKYTDGLRRYQHLQKHGVSFNDKFYPVASYKISDIRDILTRNKCILPIEYGLWGISWEGPRAWNINLIREHCPETYKKLIAMFPLIGLQGARKYAVLNRHFKSRLTQFSEFAMPKEMYPIW
jgi:hypothetical protein